MGAVDLVAHGLGYLVGFGSLLLYTPIAIRISRQRSADDLALSTWWLKVISYTCSDVYGYANGYNLSTYAETLIITIEAAVVLILVGYFQCKLFQRDFYFPFGTYLLLTLVVIVNAARWMPIIAAGQALSTILNVCAILPQLRLNHQRQTSGDYSPVTAFLACVGCTIRLFTTITLNDSDFLLLSGFGLALLINMILIGQIVYFGVVVEGKGLLAVWTADVTYRSLGHVELVSADDEESDDDIGSVHQC
jgi:mannose-P-dolichol utilization defect 1